MLNPLIGVKIRCVFPVFADKLMPYAFTKYFFSILLRKKYFVIIFLFLHLAGNNVIGSQLPKGFSQIEEAHTDRASVFYNGISIGIENIIYSVDHIKLISPEKLLKKIKNINDSVKPSLIHELKKEQTIHLSGICNKVLVQLYVNPSREVCRPLNPKLIGFIYNPSSRHLFVYINPKYQHTSSSSLTIGPPTSENWAYLNQFRLIYSGNRFGKGSSFSSKTWNSSYNLLLSNRISRGLWGLSFQNNIASNDYNNVANSMFSINHMHVSYRGNPFLIKLGEIYTSSDAALGRKNIIGVSISKNTLLSTEKYLSKGSPVIVYLSSPSQVQVFKDGKILFSQMLTPGNHSLNTKYFPSGTYEITIKTRGQNGQESSKKQLYSKFYGVPTYSGFNYEVSAGSLYADNSFEDTIQDSYEIFPKTTNIKIFNIKLTKPISASQFYSINALIPSKYDSYLSLSYTKYFNNTYFNIDQLISSGGKLASSIHLGSSTSSFNIDSQLNYSNYNLDKKNPLSLSLGTSIQNSITYQYNNFLSLALSQGYRHYSNVNYAEYGAQINYCFFYSDNLTSTANLNFSYSSRQSYYAGLSLYFRFFNNQFSFNYHPSIASQKVGQSHFSTSDVNHDVNANMRISTANRSHINVGANAGKDGREDGAHWGLQFATYSPYANLLISYNQREYFKQASAILTGGMLYTNNNIIIQKKAWQRQSGIIVNAISDKNVRYSVYDGLRFIGRAWTNVPQVFYFQPYTQHNIKINVISKNSFKYNNYSKHIVIYPGDFESLSWKLRRQIMLFGYVKLSDEKPVKAATLWINGKPSTYSTDSIGMLQASIPINQKKLVFKTQNTECRVLLNKNKHSEYYVFYPKMICKIYQKNSVSHKDIVITDPPKH